MEKKQLYPEDLFNGYVGANVAYALQKIGLFDFLKSGCKVKVEELAIQTDCDYSRLVALLKVGHALGYIEKHKEGYVSITDMGETLIGQLGYFTWSVGGYGDLFRNLGNLATEGKEWSHLRDEGEVAIGADINNRSFMEHLLFDVLDDLNFTTIADLGCGNGGRLVSLCNRYPNIKGVGIDISKDAINLANKNVKKNSFEDRIEMICTNVLDVVKNNNHNETLKNVEIVSSFMMFHDLYNIPAVWDVIFERIRETFPNIKYLLVADTVRMPDNYIEVSNELPIFSLGFELLHSYMDVKLPTKEEYDKAFTNAGLSIESCIEFGTPQTYLYLLRF
ncbi:methyltransferase domain-containing protein [Sporosarcina limicola]|uniref:SAM-dependent methyltransferase n=1 Tax=Sporosarcina limicola TaxID=34101 RepID=A0A927MLB8_9BACL|nr:methyltransferase domain-containing protein [Sporosarcina limicola]MBE1556835.1 SAM-dependent methyltransferase [Sporosarcina limicola]